MAHLMGFKHGWNKELIAQFYAIVHFYKWKGEVVMRWMTNCERYHITYSAFTKLFRIKAEDDNYEKLHDHNVLETRDMHFMYPRANRADWGKVKCSLSSVQKDDDTERWEHIRHNVVSAKSYGSYEARSSSVRCGDFLWQEIRTVSEYPQKIYNYSPFLMFMIQRVIGV